MDKLKGGFGTAKSFAEKSRTHVNSGLHKVDQQWQARSGHGSSSTATAGSSPSPSPGSSTRPPPPPSRTASGSAPPPPPPARGRATSSVSASPGAGAGGGGGGVFTGMDHREKEAFFALLDEYFASRPQYASLFSGGGTSAPAPAPRALAPPPVPPAAVPAHKAGLGTAVALYDFEGAQPEDLPFREGDRITIVEIVSDDWWKGELNGRTGILPVSYVQMEG
ncbi:hypothetical protein JCM1840_002772 [Sporobolomyces johnsonii]